MCLAVDLVSGQNSVEYLCFGFHVCIALLFIDFSSLGFLFVCLFLRRTKDAEDMEKNLKLYSTMDYKL